MTQHILVTPGKWGALTDEVVEDLTARCGIFECGVCSDERLTVHHNVIGSHVHAPADVWRMAMANKSPDEIRVVH